jgi:acyl carrier protein
VSRVFGLPPQSVNDETSNTRVRSWDSLAHVTLVLEMESTYGVCFSVEETLQMTNVGAIKRVLSGRGVRW